MKNFKSFVGIGALALGMSHGAGAADLAVKKPTATEYMKTCPVHGAGFFVVPGTNACLKLSGRVRVEYYARNATQRSAAMNAFRARGQFGYDHRQNTEYGPLRTVVALWVQNENAVTLNAVEWAFIQFAGFTAGRAPSPFDHFYQFGLSLPGPVPGANQGGGVGGYSITVGSNIFGYTAQLMPGLSATLAFEEAPGRRLRIIGAAYAGQSLPDALAVLNYTSATFDAKLSGMVRQIRVDNPTIETRYGFAVQGAARVRLPFISAGSNIWVSGSYAEGASTYTGFANFPGTGIGGAALNPTDAVIGGGRIRPTVTWAAAGGLQAFVAPTFWVGVSGSHAYNNPFGANNAFRTTTAALSAGWVPVPGFQIVGEVEHRSLNAQPGLPLVRTGSANQDTMGRVRVQRDF